MRSVSAAVFTAWLAHQAAAHGTVNSVTAGGQNYQGYEPSNPPGSQPKPAKGVVWASNDYNIGFVLPTDYSNANIICHKNALPAAKAATVAAGDTISLSWPNWPKTDAHPGVFLNYLAAAGTDDPTKIDKNGLKFFKISQSGYDPSVDANGPDKGLATGSFKKAGLVAKVQIPANIKAGTYVLRHEIIALHEAEQPNKAQNYPQCVTLQVTGGGSATPDGVPGTQLYKADEPGILVKSFYNKFDPKSYKLPGPAIWDGASSGTGTVPSPVSGPTQSNVGANPPAGTGAPPSATGVPGEGNSGSGGDPGSPTNTPPTPTSPSAPLPTSSGKGRGKGRGRHRYGGSRKWWSGNKNGQQNQRRHARDLAQA